jgi:tRNA (cmo5U34)-methyltransferase
LSLEAVEADLHRWSDDAPSSLGHEARMPWTFDQTVVHVFDDMLRRSIPDYEAMRRVVWELGRELVQPGTDVVDLGCSRGEALAPFVEAFGDSVRCVGVEVSEPMLEAARERFGQELARGIVELHDLDLRRGYPDVRASVTLFVLTLQFVPVDERGRILRSVYEHTVPGGAIVLVEKVVGSSTAHDRLLVSLHEARKRESGYTQEEIDRKRMSLVGVLVPLTALGNEELLRQAGFGEVECVWRSLNFAAWVGLKAGASP